MPYLAGNHIPISSISQKDIATTENELYLVEVSHDEYINVESIFKN